ncbi:hypothetical protein CPB85DRAFT_793183 [Mucidula mucida]|nr:hypothetical protein CPB85DRAFT_793183 [Mucidula mucida]
MARLTATVARTLMYNAHGWTTSYTDTPCDDWTVQRLGWSLDTAFNVHALRQRRLDCGRILLCQVLNSTLSSNTTAHARCHQLRCTSPLIAVQPRLADLEGVSKDYKHLRVDSSVPVHYPRCQLDRLVWPFLRVCLSSEDLHRATLRVHGFLLWVIPLTVLLLTNAIKPRLRMD